MLGNDHGPTRPKPTSISVFLEQGQVQQAESLEAARKAEPGSLVHFPGQRQETDYLKLRSL
jgi:hypothetical protein